MLGNSSRRVITAAVLAATLLAPAAGALSARPRGAPRERTAAAAAGAPIAASWLAALEGWARRLLAAGGLAAAPAAGAATAPSGDAATTCADRGAGTNPDGSCGGSVTPGGGSITSGGG